MYDEDDNVYLIDAGVGVDISLTCRVCLFCILTHTDKLTCRQTDILNHLHNAKQSKVLSENKKKVIVIVPSLNETSKLQVNSYPAAMVEWHLDGAVLAAQPSSDLPQNYDRSQQTISQFEEVCVLYI